MLSGLSTAGTTPSCYIQQSCRPLPSPTSPISTTKGQTAAAASWIGAACCWATAEHIGAALGDFSKSSRPRGSLCGHERTCRLSNVIMGNWGQKQQVCELKLLCELILVAWQKAQEDSPANVRASEFSEVLLLLSHQQSLILMPCTRVLLIMLLLDSVGKTKRTKK
ncbi:uncharacterized protein LOC119323632 isoform X1 [Triticum dicoccoides]|uniref:uncharacterized protein LOC119323632 isoform X1 n=1 Tax=Triticum dicoccoides TaxID=85692 RepID=UPI001890FB25|nr:uncharacterized protein LOC119323632 isoform X1 [Triticum dicoccoides]XP_044412798.1 uncharacterized protein LOC123137218 isoform X1 [Triticum aestivum]